MFNLALKPLFCQTCVSGSVFFGLQILNNNIKMERLIELVKRHKIQMDEKNVLISVYTNASGFLWSIMKVDSGTDLGWSEYNGDCEMSGTFTTYENALEDALNLVAKCDLKKFQKDCPNDKFHWGNYARWADSSI